MIKINISEERLKVIKDRHYNFIKEIVSKRYDKIKEKVIPKHKKCLELFCSKYINNETMLKKLIIGEPKELKEIIDDVNNNYKNILKYTDELNMMYTEFSSYNYYYNTIKAIKAIEKEQFKGKSVRKIFYKRGGNTLKSDFVYSDNIFSLNSIISKMIIELESMESRGMNEVEFKIILKKYKNIIFEKIQSIYNSYSNYKILDKDNILWGPYPLLMELGLTVCPYCNRNYIHTYYSPNNGKVRADFDHFLPKSKYPYLCVSFYNLIPSCSVCNSSLKGEDDFSIDTHINPYINGFEDEYRFTIKPVKDHKGDTDISFLLGDSNEFDIDIVCRCNDTKLAGKIRNNIDAFKIKELYNFHKDYITELIKKSIIYNPSRIDELFKLGDLKGDKLFSSKEEVINMIVSNYINKNDFGKRTLSKLTRDIAEELKLLESNFSV